MVLFDKIDRTTTKKCFYGDTALTSKDLDWMRIPRIVAQAFIWELRCFMRIDPETATLGSHSKAFSFCTPAHVIRKA